MRKTDFKTPNDFVNIIEPLGSFYGLLKGSLLTLSYSSKINGYLYHQRVSPPLKKTPWYVIRGQCCPTIWVWQPTADRNGSLAPFLFEIKLSGRVWQPSADNNGAPKGHYYLQRAVTPDQITQQNSLQRAGAP
jgi:hypothetical protein